MSDDSLSEVVGTLLAERDSRATKMFESARNRQLVHERLGSVSADIEADATLRPILQPFVERGRLFVLHGPISDVDPCPYCVLCHLADDEQLIDVLETAETAPPDSTLVETLRNESTRSEIRAALDRVSERAASGIAIVESASEDNIRGSVNSTTTVFKHPACPHDEFPERSLDPVAGVFELEKAYLDRNFGLFRSVFDVRQEMSSEWFDVLDAIHATQVQFLNPAYHAFPTKYRQLSEAGGPGLSGERARLRGYMEACERYATLAPAPGERIETETQFEERAIPATAFYFYSDDQYDRADLPFTEYDPRETYEWTECSSLTGDSAFVPADFLYPTPSGETETKLIAGNSNGSAAHFETSEALFEAVTELFERDATMRHWFTQTTQPCIRLDSLPERCRVWARTVEERGYQVSVAEVTQHEPFRVFEVFFHATSSDQYPRLVPASACELSAEAAVKSAFREALDILVVADVLEGEPLADPEDVSTTKDHFRFHQHPKNAGYERRLFDSESAVLFRAGDAEPSLSTVRRALSSLDVEVFYRDVAPPSLARRGITVVRAVSPELVPITFGHDRHRLAHPSDSIPDNRPASVPHMYP